MHKSIIAIVTLAGIMTMGSAGAKLPPLSDEAKAKAAEEKNKVAWTDKVAAYKLCLAQNKVAAHYMKTKNAKAAAAPPTADAVATASPPVAPGASVATGPAAGANATSAAPTATATAATTAAPNVSTAPIAIPPCQEPGPYVSAQDAAKDAAKVGVADSLPVPAAGKPPSAGETKK